MDIKKPTKKFKKVNTRGGKSVASSSPNTGRTSGRRLSSRMNPEEAKVETKYKDRLKGRKIFAAKEPIKDKKIVFSSAPDLHLSR